MSNCINKKGSMMIVSNEMIDQITKIIDVHDKGVLSKKEVLEIFGNLSYYSTVRPNPPNVYQSIKTDYHTLVGTVKNLFGFVDN
jgi:hypothetical protein